MRESVVDPIFYGFVISHTTTYIQFTCDKNKIRKKDLSEGIYDSASISKCDKQHIKLDSKSKHAKVGNKFQTAHLGVICPIFSFASNF